MNVTEIIKQWDCPVTVADNIICMAGILLFGCWLLRTSLGRRALADSVPRRNDMPVYMPFIPTLIWFGAVGFAILIVEEFFPDLPDWQTAFLDNSLLCIGAIAAMAVTIFLANSHFARRLKGFGLNAKTIHKDFPAAVLNLLSVLPLVMVMIILTERFGQLLWGQEFKMQQHEELKLITAYPQLPLRVLIIITAVVVVPTFEEMLFRGLFQTVLRSYLARPCPVRSESRSQTGPASARISNGAWLSIVISSSLFALVHSNAGHWPALFVLAICLGYSYEKSGSLFRPIFIHSLFNAASIIGTLYSV